MIHHIKRATRHLVFWSLIVSAVSLTTVRLLLLGIDSYKADLSTRVSELVGAPLTIGRIRANMRGYNPELVLKDIEILSSVPRLGPGNEKPAIQLKEVRLGINLLAMLIDRDRLASAWVTLVGVKLTVTRKQDGSIAIAGLKASDEQPLWLLQGGKYEVLQSEISWLDERSPTKLAVVGEVNFAIVNKAERHQVNMLVKLPKKYGDALNVSMDLKGNVFKPASVDGTIFVEGKNVKPAEWIAGELPLAMTIRSGAGDFKVWSELQHSQLVSMDGEVQLQRMRVFRQDNDVFPVKHLKTLFHWRLDGNQWRLDVEKFLLETADARGEKKWPDAVFSVAGSAQDGNFFHKTAVFVRQVDLQEASRVVRFFGPLPGEQAKFLAQAQLKGHLENFSLYADLDEKILAVNGKFAGLSVASFSRVPGIVNLSGNIKGSEKAGVLHLATEDALITAPDFFREALVIKGLKGDINWGQTATDWTLSSSKFELNLLGLQSKNRWVLTIPKTFDMPFLDMQSAFVSEDISQAKHYFPTKVMKPADVVWFDNAYLGGRVTKGSLLYVGKLGAFPSKVEEGVFEALLDIDQMDLLYVPGWPQLSNIKGQVTVLQKKMTCDLYQGQSHNLNIVQARVINPELGTSTTVMVKGELEGEISNVFKFLQKTPLASQVDFLVDAVVPRGNTRVALDLTLPLAEGITPKVYGTAQLNYASLNVAALDLWINKIDGELKFTERGVSSDAIQAVALGQPIKVNINSEDHRQTFVNITGSAEIKDLQQKFKMPGWELAKGAMAYQLRLGLPYPGSPSELFVQSDLVGVALDLPSFLAKTKNQQKSLSLTFGLGDEALLPITVNYNDKLKAAVKLNLAQQRLHSGHVLVGSGEVVQPSETGLTLEINQDSLNLQEWLGLSAHHNDNNNNRAGNSIRQIKIHSQDAQWKNIPLGIFDLILKPDGSDWTGAINSAFATGKMRIPVEFKGTEKITLDMASVDLSALKQLKSQSDVVQGTVTEPKLVLDPAAMPLFSLTSDKTLWRSVDLGRLTLETGRITDGMAFKRLELTGMEQQLKLSGDWKVNGQHSETRLQGRLEMPRAGQWLAQLDITKELMETSGDVDFSVSWNAAPHQFSLMDLQGKIDVNLKGGRMLSIEPGFGRLLGVLAVAQWIKRLQLDFSDVYKAGLTFNSIAGHFDLLKGKAVTHDLVIDAIPAKITLTGETDFINQSLDQVVKVTPKSADAIPIAGTIVGRVTGLIGKSLTGKDQEGFFFGSQYLVKGSWENAQIIPLHENGGLLQKTWNGITGFPWLTQQEEK
jgi:uncharacterized protein (TIGR02099 family)